MTYPDIYIITVKTSLTGLTSLMGTLKGYNYEVTPLPAYTRDDPRVLHAYGHMVSKEDKASAERSHRITLADKLVDYGTKGLPLTVLEDDCVFDRCPEFTSLPEGYSLVIHGTYLRSKPTIIGNYNNFYEMEGSFPMWGSHAVTYSPEAALEIGNRLLEREEPPVDALIGMVDMQGKYLHIPQYAWQAPGQEGMHGGFNFERLRIESMRSAVRAVMEYNRGIV